MSRFLKASLWITAGVLSFYLVGFVWSDSLRQRQQWPLYQAEVISTKINWAQHMTDEYALTINLKIFPDKQLPYSASLQQNGPKGALERRIETQFAFGQKLQVRINPESSTQVVLDIEPGWGPWIIASALAFILIGIGTSVFYTDTEDKEQS